MGAAVLSAVAGVALRIWAATTSLGVIDADEAVVGLMARDWLDGQATVFYWGQSYGGSQESLLVALVYAALPAAPLASKLVPAALHAATALIVWRLGKTMFSARAGLVAGALFWIWPAAFVWWSIKARGHYSVTLVLGTAALFLAVRLAGGLEGWPRRLAAAGFGLAAGLGWWASFQIVFVVAPGAIWLVLRRGRTALVDLAWAAPAAVVGALPWLAWNLTHSFASFRQPPVVAAAPPYWQRIEAFFTDAFPRAVGAVLPYSDEWTGRGFGVLALLVVVGCLGLAATAAWTRRDAHLLLLLSIVVAYPFLFAASPFFYVDEPRYLYFLAPVLALLVARPLGTAALPPAVPITALLLAGLLTLTTLATMADRGVGLFPAGDVAVPRSLGPLLATLRADGVRTVFAPYGLAYRIALDSNGDVVATPIEHVRNHEMNEAVRQSKAAWVFMAASHQVEVFEDGAARHGVEPNCNTVARFAVCQPDGPLLQEDLPELQP